MTPPVASDGGPQPQASIQRLLADPVWTLHRGIRVVVGQYLAHHLWVASLRITDQQVARDRLLQFAVRRITHVSPREGPSQDDPDLDFVIELGACVLLFSGTRQGDLGGEAKRIEWPDHARKPRGPSLSTARSGHDRVLEEDSCASPRKPALQLL